MRLAQAWRRRGLGAAAVTLVVPGALAAAVAVVLLSGGLRGLGAFGQVVTGPQVPETSVSAAKVSASHTPARLPTVPPAPAAALFAPPVGGGAPAPVTTPPVATVPPRRGGTPATGAAPAASGGGSPSSPPGGGPSDPVHQLGEAAANQVGQAPAPLGPAGHDAVTARFAAVPPPPAGARAAGPSRPPPPQRPRAGAPPPPPAGSGLPGGARPFS